MTSKTILLLLFSIAITGMFLISCVQDEHSDAGSRELIVQLPENITFRDVRGLTVGEIFSHQWDKLPSTTGGLVPEQLSKSSALIPFEGAHVASIWWNHLAVPDPVADHNWIYWRGVTNWKQAMKNVEDNPMMELLTNGKLQKNGENMEAEIKIREGRTDLHIIFFNQFNPVFYYENTYYYNFEGHKDGWLAPLQPAGTLGAEFCQSATPVCGAYFGWENPEQCQDILTANCQITTQVEAYFQCLNMCTMVTCDEFQLCMGGCYNECN